MENTQPEADEAIRAAALSDDKTHIAAAFMAKRLLPAILGLALARVGLIVGSYGSYSSTDAGFFTDGGSIASLVIMAFMLLVLRLSKYHFPDKLAALLNRVFIAGTCIILIAQAVLVCADIVIDQVLFVFSVFLSLFASCSMMYWLRIAKGTSSVTAILYTFCALGISEVVILALAFLPEAVRLVLGAVLVLAQILCMWKVASRQPFAPAFNISEFISYYGVDRESMGDKPFLIATAFGIGLIGIVGGLLRGYPDGLAIPFTMPTRIAYMVITLVLSFVVVLMAMRGRKLVMTVNAWVIIQLAASLALVLYALFPDNLEYGAMFATMLNSLMVAMLWYTVIAFESHGWHDPYYYALAGWLVWLGCRGFARISLLLIAPFVIDSLFVNALMSLLLLVSTQVIFVNYYRSAANARSMPEAPVASSETAQPVGRPMPFDGLMGLDDPRPQAAAQPHAGGIEESIARLGRQFMLSEREVEVLSLYAQGYTQKRVAEVLFISQGTAHTHIKRIYSKTGMHSRQDILDYIEHYTGD